jgi:hypothetical protein
MHCIQSEPWLLLRLKDYHDFIIYSDGFANPSLFLSEPLKLISQMIILTTIIREILKRGIIVQTIKANPY